MRPKVNFRIRPYNASLRLALLACISVSGLTSCNAQQKSSGAASTQQTTSQKIAALQGLRDSGVLTDEEYAQKVAALKNGAPAMQTTSSGGGSVTHTLMDQAWGLPAATLSAPAGWGFAGGVVHAAGGDCTVTGTSPVMNIESRDGSEGLVIMPALRAQYVSDPATMQPYAAHGCLVATGTTAVDFIKGIVIPKARPGARVLEAGPSPMLEQQVAQATQQARSSGMPTVFSSARVRISYTRNGRQVEEFVTGMVGCSRQQTPGTRGFSVDCTADELSLLHAPAGELDALAARFTSIDMKPNPAWKQRMAQDNQNYQQASANRMQQQNNQNQQNANAYLQNNLNTIHNSAQQGQNNVDAIHDIGNRSMAIDRQRQGAIDRSAQGTALSMTNSNMYTDPNTGKQVQLSDQYGHTYVNSEGTMVQQTNSASGPIGGGWWTEMVPQY